MALRPGARRGGRNRVGQARQHRATRGARDRGGRAPPRRALLADGAAGELRPRAAAPNTNGSVLHLARAPLLRFAPAELAAGADDVRCSFSIRGGLLARRAGGALVLSQSNDRELRATVTGFVPRLGARPYDRLEHRIHVAISRRFFRSLIVE